MLDLLADVRFELDEILHTVEIEHSVEPVDGFLQAVRRIDQDAETLMSRLGAAALPGRRDASSYPFLRDPEIADVLARIARELRTVEELRGPERDMALSRVEDAAAPYALALFYEIARLDAVLQRVSVASAAEDSIASP